jgi:hypothetical protein
MNLIEQINRIQEIIKSKDAPAEFDNWVIPKLNKLKLEYEIEHNLKGHEFFDSEKEFLKSVKNGKIIIVTPKLDSELNYRHKTNSYDELLDLIKTYKSYPQYRNETTLKKLYDRFNNNEEIDLPIIIEFSDGRKRIFSGNTRIDIAFQLGMYPKAILIKSQNY